MRAAVAAPRAEGFNAPPVPSSRERAAEILELVMRHRRAASNDPSCGHGCAACAAPHLEKVTGAVERGEPVVFVLPAFPGKSPNPMKVLGARPDMAERRSLGFLETLCGRIGEIHGPGARMVVCSDGRVFSDAVGIEEGDITTYQRGLAAIIVDIGARHLTTFNLDDIFEGVGFDAMRARLMADHGEPIDVLRSEVLAGGDALRLYRGITRFLLEDSMRPGMGVSKSALQKECRTRAYAVIQRSRAWDRILAERFPDAVRLSIHPQGCGSRKIGIHLMETSDEWLTPWHGVAVEIGGRFRLMKRAHAEALDAELIYAGGHPSHYVAPDPRTSAHQRAHESALVPADSDLVRMEESVR